MGKKNKWVRLGYGMLGVLLLFSGCGKKKEPETKTEVETEISAETEETEQNEGFPAQIPAFSTKDLEGNTVTESIFGEKDLTVINIWGTFCGPCVGEMPELGEWVKNMPEEVQLIGLIVDIKGEEDTEHKEKAAAILEEADADFLQLIANADFAPVMEWVIGVPTTLFVDQEGNLVGDPIVGARVDEYKSFVEAYLSEQQ
ncbi:MAG: TlpA family protein disulfide reductase [Lachnospiraceae bacterium]|nr:TlpA family protein disulfide reductase [Lachnospiraceae bacterium]